MSKREHRCNTTPQQMEIIERWDAVERRRWDDRIRRGIQIGLVVFMVLIFGVSFLWTLYFLTSGMNAQTSWVWVKPVVSALGATGSGCYLRQIIRHYFPTRDGEASPSV